MCSTRSLCQQVPPASARPRPTPAPCKKMQFIDGIPVWGNPEQGAVSQIKTCARTADKVALMADHHKGYAAPIRGAASYQEVVTTSRAWLALESCSSAARHSRVRKSLRRSLH